MRHPLSFAPLRLCVSLFFVCSGAFAAEPFPGTKLLEMQGDITDQLVAGVDKFLLNEIDASVERRARHWKRDTSSVEAYNKSVAENRKHLARIIGAVDPRVPFDGLELVGTTSQPALVGRGSGFEVYAVRWPVLKGVDGEGLLLKPAKPNGATCIAIPDADQTPEMLAGLMAGVAPEAQFARRLAESGCQVIVPMLIDRADTFSIAAGGERPTNQPHREFIYRQAFEMGRHIIGYEVQKVLALVDWLDKTRDESSKALGVYGYGEGGLLALYSAALDTRIDVTCVSGYLGPRERVWEEPIYRNVWALLDEFGDAEIVSLIHPRKLVVEASRVPQVSGPPEARNGRSGAAPGRLETPTIQAIQQELWTRATSLLAPLKCEIELVINEDGRLSDDTATSSFLNKLALTSLARSGETPAHLRKDFDPNVRLKRQLDQLTEFTQGLMRESEYVRAKFMAKADRASRDPAKWAESTKPYRQIFYDDVIGRFEREMLPPNVRTRQVYDESAYRGYEVVMDVFPDVIAYGVLLVPKDVKPGEKRPVVVCQHGLEGRPQDTIEANVPGERYYHQFAAKLAEQGFITFAPQNLYIFKDRFRTLQRKANVLKKTLFSIIVPQHQQIVDWLATLPIVDPERIAFYGLSYGGKTAMRVPALVERYCLSICSGDFNEWIWKNASTRFRGSYMGTGEYEIFEFDLGNTFNYAEMAGLIAPRPFMVERGHRDGVGIDEWVSYEYAKVRLLYVDLKIPERTTIEYFDGPHTIHGVGTYQFLHEKLNWPAR
jgi:dienelactone hydrolase